MDYAFETPRRIQLRGDLESKFWVRFLTGDVVKGKFIWYIRQVAKLGIGPAQFHASRKTSARLPGKPPTARRPSTGPLAYQSKLM